MIEAFINTLLDDGWLFNNCYQTDQGIWRVNLRRPSDTGDYFTSWAESPSFLGALQACVGKLEDATFHEEPRTTIPKPEPAQAKKSTADLLADIGL